MLGSALFEISFSDDVFFFSRRQRRSIFKMVAKFHTPPFGHPPGKQSVGAPLLHCPWLARGLVFQRPLLVRSSGMFSPCVGQLFPFEQATSPPLYLGVPQFGSPLLGLNVAMTYIVCAGLRTSIFLSLSTVVPFFFLSRNSITIHFPILLVDFMNFLFFFSEQQETLCRQRQDLSLFFFSHSSGQKLPPPPIEFFLAAAAQLSYARVQVFFFLCGRRSIAPACLLFLSGSQFFFVTTPPSFFF